MYGNHSRKSKYDPHTGPKVNVLYYHTPMPNILDILPLAAAVCQGCSNGVLHTSFLSS